MEIGYLVFTLLLMCTLFTCCYGSIPTLTDKSEDKQVASNSNVLLSCAFKSVNSKDFSIVWLKDGNLIAYNQQVYINNITEFQQILTIQNITQSNIGLYSCVGENVDGKVTGVIKVTLLDFKPKIYDLPDVYLKAGESYDIQCAANALPQAKYSWKRKNGFFKNTVDGGNGKLSISRMDSDLQGQYDCTALNKVGETTKGFQLILVTDTKILVSPTDVNVTAGEEYYLTTSVASVVNPVISWFKDGNVINNDTYKTEKVGSLYQTSIFFPKLDVLDSGTYEVHVDLPLVSGLAKRMLLTVWSKPIVQIIEGKSLSITEGDTALFLCSVSANPYSNIEWLLNGTVLLSSNKNQSNEGNRMVLKFEISDVTKDNEGNYQCVAANNLGKGSATIKLDIIAAIAGPGKKDNNKLITVIVILSILAILIIVVAVFLYIRYKDKWCGGYDYATGTFYTDLDQYEKDSTLADIENNPYAIKKNINISIKHGGRTMSSTATKKPSHSISRTGKRSVKALNPLVENNYAPLDSIVCQGRPVDFKRIVFDEILGEGEYGTVTGGRLLDEEELTACKDVSIKMLKEHATAQERCDILSELRMMRRIARHKHVVDLVGWCITDENVYVLEEYVPFGSLLTFLRTNRLLALSTERIDHIDEDDRVSQENLLSFALQITEGMDHLSQLQIVHRDLACRNIFIGHEKICKISEYGLSRDIYAENVFRKTTGGQLPVRWMAYESVFEGTYTSKSDVWSYGILLWELCTLGKIPYPGIVRTEQLLDELESGYHMENPGHISTDLYLLMNSCWNRIPDNRPSFADLKKKLSNLIEDKSELHIDLAKLFDDEFHEENDDILSPTTDFHRRGGPFNEDLVEEANEPIA